MSLHTAAHLQEALQRWVRSSPNAVALVGASERVSLTYAELDGALEAVAQYLEEQAVKPGEILSLLADNSLASAVFLLGAVCAGRVVNPIAPSVTREQLHGLLEHSGSVLVVAQAGLVLEPWGRVRLAALPPVLAEPTRRVVRSALTRESGALLVYTSGTLGAPKGVLLRHGNILANVATALENLPYSAEHRTLTVLPLFHTFAVISDLLTMLLSGRTCVIGETFDLKKLGALQQVLIEQRVNSFSAAPLIFDLMLKLNVQLPNSLAFCVAGAAPLSAALIGAFQERYGVPIIPAYGMTETTCFATISPPEAVRPGSCGRAVGCAIRVVTDSGLLAAIGEVGEFQIRGESVMKSGYFRNAVSAYAQGDDVEEWLHTGDLGYSDADGYLFIVGRKKNMVIRGGEKVYLEELDTALARMPGVLDAASVGLAREPIERIVTFVVPQTDVSLEVAEIFAYLRATVGQAKCPDRVAFATGIPRTPSNKVRTAELRVRAEELVP